jgi:uncharacterized membrane protein (UPF0127 family)
MTSRSCAPEYSVENITRGITLATKIRLASDSAQRRRGLLGINELASGAGIWINPCEAVHTFGMRIALDAVFLDAKLRVKKVSAHLKPGRIAVCLTATSVLELGAGAAAATQAGDQLSFTKASTPQETHSPVDKQA